jgi:hypothetical protein
MWILETLLSPGKGQFYFTHFKFNRLKKITSLLMIGISFAQGLCEAVKGEAKRKEGDGSYGFRRHVRTEMGAGARAE